MRKRTAVTTGCMKFGWDFFMVDPRGLAAPFHIETVSDVILFVEEANPAIGWVASSTPKQG
jgi:hypothetical protein